MVFFQIEKKEKSLSDGHLDRHKQAHIVLNYFNWHVSIVYRSKKRKSWFLTENRSNKKHVCNYIEEVTVVNNIGVWW